MSFTFSAFHLGKHLNLSKILDKVRFDLLKDEKSFVLFQRDESSFVYLKSYGSIVFCNFTESEMMEFISSVFPYPFDFDTLVSEEYDLEVEAETKLEVRFNTVIVDQFSVDILHIIMFNLSQSVALDNYQIRTNELLEETRKMSNKLKETGDVGFRKRRLQKFIGRAMTLKTRIAENLLIFETSDLAWSKKQLSELDTELRTELDIINRHHGLQYSLNIVKENLDLFKDILQHKHSSALEWIIIILIFLEIIDMIMNKII